MRLAVFTLGLVLALAGQFGPAGGALAQSRPLTPAEGRYWPFSWPFQSNLPNCAQDAVLARIQSRFSQRERTYWKSGLQIAEFTGVRETGLRTAGVDLIPRRYCQASAMMSDNKARHVVYWIGENQGMIGFSWGVEWCIVGLDHHNAFGPNCRAAGP